MKQLKAGARALARMLPLPIRIALRRLQWFVMWVVPRLGELFVPNARGKQRILLIYDTSAQPFSVGDILVCQEAALVLCQKHQVNIVDFAVLYDPENPAASNPVFAKAVTKENVMDHIASLLPLAQVNQNLGSFFVFNSREQVVRLIADNADLYHVWPSGLQVGTRQYLPSVVFNDLLVDHYREHGSIPQLTFRPYLRKWAAQFYRENVSPKVAVTVNLRNNKGWDLCRNSQMESWLECFRYCETRYPVSFVILCARSEIDDRLRGCGNVILAKDYQTSVEQDMALIHMSAMHMGAGSGPATMAWFGAKPYLMIDNASNADSDFYKHEHMIERLGDNIRKFWFAGPGQRIHVGLETGELLIREFQTLFRGLNLEQWTNSINAEAGADVELNTWLR